MTTWMAQTEHIVQTPDGPRSEHSTSVRIEVEDTDRFVHLLSVTGALCSFARFPNSAEYLSITLKSKGATSLHLVRPTAEQLPDDDRPLTVVVGGGYAGEERIEVRGQAAADAELIKARNRFGNVSTIVPGNALVTSP